MPPTEPASSEPIVPARLLAVGVPGLPEFRAGDDLAALLVDALHRAGLRLLPGDVLVVSSKVVSKTEGRTFAAASRQPAIEAETIRVVAERVTPRGVTRIVQSRSGPVLAAAGVDASNVTPGTVLLLPGDPDASAASLRARLAGLTGLSPDQLGVLVSDTAGRPWRDGQTDIAIGSSGVRVVDDLRGGTDPLGNPLEVTVRALADELAALADLVKGKLDGVPVALVRGLSGLPGLLDGDAPGAASLLRSGAGDWFRLGHVEAARAAIGLPPGHPAVEPVRMPAEPATLRLRRAVRLAVAAPDPVTGPSPAARWRVLEPAAAAEPVRLLPLTPGDDQAAAWLALGGLAQRVAVAAWAEDLAVALRVDPGPPPALLVEPATGPAATPAG